MAENSHVFRHKKQKIDRSPSKFGVGTSIQSMEPLILSMLGFFVFGVESFAGRQVAWPNRLKTRQERIEL